jgi:pimeloyl-ACP methyl ester carboxylesterase
MVRSGYAPVNGLEMYFEVHGFGPPMVSIHPALGMANVFPSLASRRTLIAMDLQGHGRTPDIDRALSFEQNADDVAALMRYLGVEQAEVMGEGFGGTAALSLASRHPDLVGKVVLYSAPFRVAGGPPVHSEHAAVAYQREHYRRMAPDPDQWATLFHKVADMRWDGFTAEMFKDFQAPVLVGVGDHDFIPVSAAVELARMIPHAQLAVVPGAGHFLLNVNAEKFLSLALGFLDEEPSVRSFATQLTGYLPGVNQ